MASLGLTLPPWFTIDSVDSIIEAEPVPDVTTFFLSRHAPSQTFPSALGAVSRC